MKKYRIGVLGPSEIAFRRMVPAIVDSGHFDNAGVAHASCEEYPGQSDGHAAKCGRFADTYGGNIYESFAELLSDADVDAVYIPLPPSEHLRWAVAAFDAGKHVLVEKPSTACLSDTVRMTEAAKKSGLALHENYAYAYHAQVKAIRDILESGRIGELRLVRATFSFPYRGENDFRYHADRGGGSIIDCGGYPVNFASGFLGEDVRVISSSLLSTRGHDVDTYGAATLAGDNGAIAQVSWGMDNVYRCGAELHGSTGMISTDRLYSPPASMAPVILITDNSGVEKIEVQADDQFGRSLDHFAKCIEDSDTAAARRAQILRQAGLIQSIIEKSRDNNL
ncbi:MAG: Gfo/Idh/MocA family oxidoreductase [Mogibacterium sp.]|nr:Gfo/Idh/MocA family oxidoreductase [Mogibacterium sp.]